MSAIISEESIKKFDIFMEKLGYSPDNSQIHLEKEKDIPIQINYKFEDGSAIGIYFYIIFWENKRSYVYNIFSHDFLQDHPLLEGFLRSHIDPIKYEEKTRIGAIGWEAIYTKQPSEYDVIERKKILFDIYKKGSQFLLNGLQTYDEKYDPKPGDILISRPLGPKISEGFTNPSMELGTKQRGKIAQRYGFGPVDSNNLQYARYNKNLKLEPI